MYDISVAIPVRKGGNADVTLRSLERQPELSFEVCIAHDDGTGASWARNLAAAMCTAPFILFSDDDIEWEPGAFKLLADTLTANPDCSYAYGAWQMIGGPRNGLVQCNRSWSGPRLRMGSYISTMVMMRKDHFPGFDPLCKRLVDWEMFLRMYLYQQRKGVYCGSLTFRTRERQGITSDGEWTWEQAKSYVVSKHGLDGPRKR